LKVKAQALLVTEKPPIFLSIFNTVFAFRIYSRE